MRNQRRLATAAFATALLLALPGVAQAPIFKGDFEDLAEQNTDFRRVLFTGKNLQVVAMSIPGGEEIGEEVHKSDQCFFFIDGDAEAIIEGNSSKVGEDGMLCVPAGTRHNIRNTGGEDLKLLTAYGPPAHPPGTVHRTKAEAQQAEGAAPPP